MRAKKKLMKRTSSNSMDESVGLCILWFMCIVEIYSRCKKEKRISFVCEMNLFPICLKCIFGLVSVVFSSRLINSETNVQIVTLLHLNGNNIVSMICSNCVGNIILSYLLAQVKLHLRTRGLWKN